MLILFKDFIENSGIYSTPIIDYTQILIKFKTKTEQLYL